MAKLLLILLLVVLALAVGYAPSRGYRRSVRLWEEVNKVNKDTSVEVQALIDKFTNGKIETDDFASELVRKDVAVTAEKNKLEKDKEISAAVGLGLIGMVVGGLADGAFADGDAPYLPLVFPLLTGGGSYALMNKVDENPVSKFLKNSFGPLVISVRKTILALVNKKIDDTKNAINKKAEDTIQAIVDAPTNLQKAVTKKVEDTVTSTTDYIVSIPTNVQSTIIRSVDNTKQAAKQSVDNTIADIQAIPGNVATLATQKLESLNKEIAAVPQRITTSATSAVESKKKEIVSAVSTKINEVKSVVPNIPLPTIPDINPPSAPIAKAPAPVTKAPAPVVAKAPAPVTKAPAPVVAKAPAPVTKAPAPVVAKAPASAYSGSLYGSRLSSKPATPSVLSKSPETPVKTAAPAKVEAKKTEPVEKAPVAVAVTKAPAAVKSDSFFSFLDKGSDKTVAAVKAAPSTPAVKAQPDVISETKKVAPSAYSGSLYGSRLSSKPATPSVLSKSPETPVKTAAPAKVEAKKTEPAVVKAAPAPAAKSPAPVTKASAPASAPSTTVSTTSLSSAAVKAISSINTNPSAITKIDAALKAFDSNSLGAESLFKTIVNELGSKDDALAVLPYCIGSLPRGDAKTNLNNYYQQFV